jgi:monofunctional biosynthetic peptidoglycan transglycosylase
MRLNRFFTGISGTRIRHITVIAAKSFVLFHAIFIAVIFLYGLYLRNFNPPVASIMIYRTMFNHIVPKKQYKVPVSYMKRKYLNLIVSTEDPAFYRHIGIDIPSMISAAKVNMRYKQKLSGASTITQQMTRTLIFCPDKLYIRKYLEIIAALVFNAVIPKNRQLELYINYAEWGRGMYGINTASIYYYRTPVYKLSDDQVVRLITVLSSPIKHSPNNFEWRARMRQRYERILDIMNTYYSAQ